MSVTFDKGSNTFLLEDFKERRGFKRDETLASEIVNGLLRFLHPGDIVGKRSLVISRFCRVETQELGQCVSVLAVFVDTKLEIFGKCLVESCVISHIQ